MNLFNELKRRNVFRIAGIYAVVGWILMQVAGTLEESLNLPAWFDSVITAGLLIGFPIALLLAWAFEMTPEGVKPTETLEGDSNTAPSSKKMDSVIIVGIVLILALGLWQQMTKPVISQVNSTQVKATETKAVSSIDKKAPIKIAKETEILDASIAILPFKDLSPAGDQEYFSDGMSEEIINVLVKIDPLKVSSRTSAFQFKGSNIGIPKIANQLKVRYILEGSVRKSGDTLRITAQLIDTQNDKHLLSQTYDRPLNAKNIFAIQDDIANAILLALTDELDLAKPEKISSNISTNNLNAYELYLKAKPLFLARTDLDKSDKYLTEAVKLDPSYAKAWEMRAALQTLMLEYGYAEYGTDAKDVDYLAEKFALKAIHIEPKSALAKAVVANIHLNANKALREKYNIAESIDLYTQAIEIDPNIATTFNWRALAYLSIGDIEKALTDFERCLELEPLYSTCYSNSAEVQGQQYGDERYGELLQIGLDKNIFHLYFVNLSWLARNGHELLFTVVANRSRLGGWHSTDELYQAFLHPQENHRQLIDNIINFAKKEKVKVQFAISELLVPLGAHELIPSTLLWWGVEYQFYRQSSEFKVYIKQSGIYDYWQQYGYPPQCRAVGEDDFECD